jgi:hypothetical protein
MNITVKHCVYNTETLPKEILDKPEFKEAIAKAEKRKSELEALKISEQKPVEQIKKAYKKQDED